MHILAVDDELLALSLLDDAICKAMPGQRPVCFSAPDAALQYAEQHPVDVAFLDVEMEGMNGVELARELIALFPKVNIVFVTGFDEYLEDAFKLHASGYILKPVKMQRVRKELENLRHPPEERDGKTYRIGPFEFDDKAFRVTRNGRDLLLGPKEYALFHLLAENHGIFFSADKLYQQIWGQDSNEDIRTIYPHMSRLRKKLELDTDPFIDIEQKRGKGYRLLIFKEDKT